MKNSKMNIYLSIGLFTTAIALVMKRFDVLPVFLQEIMFGAGLSLELVGLYAMNHNLTKLKNLKRRLLNKLISTQRS